MVGTYSNYLTRKDIKSIGGLIADDEIFMPCKGIRSIFVSNYARVISKRCKKARLLKAYFSQGYHYLTLESLNGKCGRKCYSIHRLVAIAFCPVAEWIKDGEKLDVHHIIAVDPNVDDPTLDYASNLIWLPKGIHKYVDKIEKMQVRQNNRWKSMQLLDVAEYYGISPYDLCKFIHKRKWHNHKQVMTQIYKGCVQLSDRIIEMEIKVKRGKVNDK